MLKFWFSRLSRGWKGNEWPKMLKISVCHTLYFRNHISYDLQLWCACIYKRIISPGIFFHFLFFSKFWFSGSLGKWQVEGVGVRKGQKMAHNDKKFCLTLYLRNHISYIMIFVTRVKWWNLQEIFSFFKILIFGSSRGVKGKKWPKITNFSMFGSISLRFW